MLIVLYGLISCVDRQILVLVGSFWYTNATRIRWVLVKFWRNENAVFWAWKANDYPKCVWRYSSYL